MYDDHLRAALDPELPPSVRVEALQAGADPRHADAPQIAAVISVARRLLADPYAEVRTQAAALLFWAVRAQFRYQTPPERLAIIDAIEPELDAAIAAGLDKTIGMLGFLLRHNVIPKLRATNGVIADHDGQPC